MRWLYKLEYKYGRYYIRNLMMVVVIGMAGVYLIDGLGSAAGWSLSSLLSLDRAAILRGQVWRLVTFVFVPPSAGNPLFLLISLYFYFMMGRLLDNAWGGFKLNVYYLCGMLGAIVAMFITGFGTNTYLNLSLFLAFATIAPDTQFLLFFIIPIKAKWMAIAYAAFLVYDLLRIFIYSPMLGLLNLVSLLLSLLNYALFFGPTLIGGIKEQVRISRNRRNWRNNNNNWH